MARGPLDLLVAALLCSPLGVAAAAPRVVASLDDPAGDEQGPGSYSLPASGEFQRGDFDLRHFTVSIDGDDVLFEVTLGAPIRPPQVAIRSGSTPVPLDNGVYLQNVDIYVDTGGEAPGFSRCVPGRRVGFAGGATWKVAVVLAPLPAAAREATVEALGKKAADRVLFAERIQSRGRTLVARLPAAALGGPPRPEWGYAVMISGAAWDRSYAMVAKLRGADEVDALTLPVLPVAERWAFGGAPRGDLYPRVLDVLLPEGADQKAVLGSWDAATRTFARVPFVYAVKPAPPAVAGGATQPPEPLRTVADVAGEVVSISGPPNGLKPLQLGRVVAPDGATVARIVVIQLVDGGLVARAVEGKERVERGARVVFEGDGSP